MYYLTTEKAVRWVCQVLVSKRYNCIKMVYCGTIMVDSCTPKKLLEHFLEFVNNVSFELKLMPHINLEIF